MTAMSRIATAVRIPTTGIVTLLLSAAAAPAADDGVTPLFNGKDLTGWKTPGDVKEHWKVHDNIIDYDGGCKGEVKDLWTVKEYGDFVLKADWRFPKKDKPNMRTVDHILPDGTQAKDADGKLKEIVIDYAGDSGIYLRGSIKSQVNIWNWPIGSGEVYGYRTDKSMPPEVRAAVTPKTNADKPVGQWNRFEITMKGDRLTVVLNGKTVIEKARLPGVAAKGPIALQHHGDPIQFRNISIKELK